MADRNALSLMAPRWESPQKVTGWQPSDLGSRKRMSWVGIMGAPDAVIRGAELAVGKRDAERLYGAAWKLKAPLWGNYNGSTRASFFGRTVCFGDILKCKALPDLKRNMSLGDRIE